jgi:hypothetical protein
LQIEDQLIPDGGGELEKSGDDETLDESDLEKELPAVAKKSGDTRKETANESDPRKEPPAVAKKSSDTSKETADESDPKEEPPTVAKESRISTTPYPSDHQRSMPAKDFRGTTG